MMSEGEMLWKTMYKIWPSVFSLKFCTVCYWPLCFCHVDYCFMSEMVASCVTPVSLGVYKHFHPETGPQKLTLPSNFASWSCFSCFLCVLVLEHLALVLLVFCLPPGSYRGNRAGKYIFLKVLHSLTNAKPIPNNMLSNFFLGIAKPKHARVITIL